MGNQIDPTDLDFDEVYELFTRSYLNAVGSAQSREWFERHFWTWKFFGSRIGMVAVRFQDCGLVKLTGIAGAKLGIIKGLNDVLAMGKPVWSAVSHDMVAQACRAGFLSPPAWIMRAVLDKIGARITKGRLLQVHRDGSFSMNLSNIGIVRKSFVSNKSYYTWLAREGPARFADEWRQIPDSVNIAIRALARGGQIDDKYHMLRRLNGNLGARQTSFAGRE